MTSFASELSHWFALYNRSHERTVWAIINMGIIGAIWGCFGVCTILLFAIIRLTPHALEAIGGGLSALQWLLLVLWCVFMLFTEGYRGFQKKFSPRTAARVRYLRDQPQLLRTIFAPIFCMGFFHANKKTRIIAYCLTFGILILVLLVRLLDQPWRGIIDVGVVLGLSYGLLSFLYFTYLAMTRDQFAHSPETR